ncbi:MAG: GntR family transcriptional regulator [Lachnospiraceae bacterium]|jgi:DNA-binding transcriptional regulator YhcF (GntR family)|nr:GntR family transcriptional regulator [Lachnospiraceae bacterium]
MNLETEESMEYKNNMPIYLQVMEDIKARIVNGEIALGQKLPSSRELAVQYEINPNTAARIYSELERDGVTFTKRGIGTFVTEEPWMVTKMKEEAVSKVVEDFIQTMESMGFNSEEILKELQKKI